MRVTQSSCRTGGSEGDTIHVRRWLLPLFPFALVCLVRADGPADNLLDKVRPVPPKGIAVADSRSRRAPGGCRRAGQGDRRPAKRRSRARPELLELLPDVQIYHNAVRYAL